MSKGLGKVEKTILQALEAHPRDGNTNRAYRGGTSVSELAYYVQYGLDCFEGDVHNEPSIATYQSTARAVRSLELKGLIICQHVQRNGMERRSGLVVGGLSWNKGVRLNKCLDHMQMSDGINTYPAKQSSGEHLPKALVGVEAKKLNEGIVK